MSDNDLVKRLREGTNGTDVTKTDAVMTAYMHEAADRIEALTEQLEAARLDAKEAEAYALWLEGKLQKTEKALESICFESVGDEGIYTARAALEELKGDKT